jgi:uncharacterized protein
LVSDDPLNYQVMTEDALRGVMRRALSVVAERGLMGQHHFYLTFRTTYPGVQIPDHLRDRHPEEMTIVIQHQYWGLEVTDTGFKVSLSFNGQQERLIIPFAAVSAFVDPSVQFGLQFSVAAPANAQVATLAPIKSGAPAKSGALAPASPPAAAADTAATSDAPPAAPPPPLPGDEGSRVVALDAFRKSDARKK